MPPLTWPARNAYGPVQGTGTSQELPPTYQNRHSYAPPHTYHRRISIVTGRTRPGLMLLKCTPPGVWRLRMLRESPPCVYITLFWGQPTNRHEQDSAHRTNKVLIKWKQAPDSARQLLRQFTRWRVGGKRCDQNLWGIIVCNFQLSVIFRCWLLATFMYECISNKQVWTKHVVVVVIGVRI